MNLKLKYLTLFFLLFKSYCYNNELPNIIIILADDLGYNDLSCYGSENNHTPNIDEMAIQGQKWTQFYSASHICSPSRAALLTGQYPIRTGTDSHVFFEWSAEGIPTESTTIAEVLDQKGYNTYCVGKWHLGHREEYLPLNHGFDYFFGIPYSNDMRVDPEMKVSEGVLFRNEMTLEKMRTKGNKIDNWIPLMQGNEIVEYPADQTTLTNRYINKSIELIKSDKKPFFLLLSHHLPHIPIYLPDSNKDPELSLYSNAISAIDLSVGKILNCLRELNIEKNTLVIFTSDNGPDKIFNQNGGDASPLRGSKFFASEGGQKVPAIFWWPTKIRPSNIDCLGSTLDFFSTFANLAKIQTQFNYELDSYDLTSTLLHLTPSPRNNFFYFSSFIPPRGEIYAVRKNQWKAHFFTSLEPEYYNKNSIIENLHPLLFNLNDDPGENRNLSTDYPEIIEELRILAENFKKSITPIPSSKYNKKIHFQERPNWAK